MEKRGCFVLGTAFHPSAHLIPNDRQALRSIVMRE
jgi:hypothetical protein